MVSLPAFEKARSIEHCCQLVGKCRASVEQKYDGEYRQVHVSVLAGSAELQISSKTGRDSTKDRVDIHDAIKRCLRIDNTHSLVKQQYIFVTRTDDASSLYMKIAEMPRYIKAVDLSPKLHQFPSKSERCSHSPIGRRRYSQTMSLEVPHFAASQRNAKTIHIPRSHSPIWLISAPRARQPCLHRTILSTY